MKSFLLLLDKLLNSNLDISSYIFSVYQILNLT